MAAERSQLKREMTKPELHPACAAFPALPEADLETLAESIRQLGLLEPITLLDGLLLDGRCRWDACERAGVATRTVEYTGNDPIGFVLAKNAERRHLTADQKAMAVATLITLRRGTNRHTKLDPSNSRIYKVPELAKQAGLTRTLLESAQAVRKHGAPHIAAMVERGEVKARVAADAVRHTPRAAQSTMTKADVVRAAKQVRDSEQKRAAAPKAPGKKSAKQPNKLHTIAPDVVIAALRPLVKEVKAQSRQHPARVSLAGLSIIASAFEKIFAAWAKGDAAEIARISRHVAGNYVRDSTYEGNHEFHRNKAGQ